MTHQKNVKVTINFLPEWTRVNISPTVNLSSWVIWKVEYPEDSNMSLTGASLMPEGGNPKNSTSLAVESSQWMATIGTEAPSEDDREEKIRVAWGRYTLKVNVVWGPTGWDPQYSTEIQAPVRVVHGLEELLSKEYRVHAWNELIIDIWALGAILDLSWPLTLEYFPDYRESDAHETLDAGKYYRDPDGQLHMSTAGLPPGLGRVRLVGQDRNGEVSEVDITTRILGDAPFTAGHMEGYDPDTQVLTIGGWNNADLYGIYDKEGFEGNIVMIGWNKVRYTRVTDGDRTYFTLVFPSGFQYGREYAFDITAFKVDINGNPIGAYGTPVKFFLPQPMSQAPTIKGMAIHRSYNERTLRYGVHEGDGMPNIPELYINGEKVAWAGIGNGPNELKIPTDVLRDWENIVSLTVHDNMKGMAGATSPVLMEFMRLDEGSVSQPNVTPWEDGSIVSITFFGGIEKFLSELEAKLDGKRIEGTWLWNTFRVKVPNMGTKQQLIFYVNQKRMDSDGVWKEYKVDRNATIDAENTAPTDIIFTANRLQEWSIKVGDIAGMVTCVDQESTCTYTGGDSNGFFRVEPDGTIVVLRADISAGKHGIRVVAQDAGGKKYEKTVETTVESAPLIPPTLTLNGLPEITIEEGTEFIDPGASCTNPNPKTECRVLVSGEVDDTTPGEYTLYYVVAVVRDGTLVPFPWVHAERKVTVVKKVTDAPTELSFTLPSEVYLGDSVRITWHVSDKDGPISVVWITVWNKSPLAVEVLPDGSFSYGFLAMLIGTTTVSVSTTGVNSRWEPSEKVVDTKSFTTKNKETNLPPVPTFEGFTTEGSLSANVTGQLTATDPTNDPLNFTLKMPPATWNLEVNPNGSYHFTGKVMPWSYTFTYRVTDDKGAFADKTATINVTDPFTFTPPQNVYAEDNGGHISIDAGKFTYSGTLGRLYTTQVWVQSAEPIPWVDPQKTISIDSEWSVTIGPVNYNDSKDHILNVNYKILNDKGQVVWNSSYTVTVNDNS